MHCRSFVVYLRVNHSITVMKTIQFFLCAATIFLFAACSSGSSVRSDSNAETSVTKSGEIVTPEDAIYAAKYVIRDEFAKDARFVEDECIAYGTDVSGRYRVEGRFSSLSKDYSALVFGIYIQKFRSGWEYGNFMIKNAYDGEYLVQKKGRMKEMDQKEGVGDMISAGGINFTVAENFSNGIRIYTDQKLSRDQLKAAIIDLRPKYESIQFATTAKHERGDEYAGWMGDMFFDYDADEIIGKGKFIP